MLTGDNSASQEGRRTVADSAPPQWRTSAMMNETASGRLARNVMTIGMAISPRLSERVSALNGARGYLVFASAGTLRRASTTSTGQPHATRTAPMRAGARPYDWSCRVPNHPRLLVDKRTQRQQQRRELTWQRAAQEHNGTGESLQQPPHAVSPSADTPLRATTSSLANAQWSSWKNGLFS